MSVQADGCYPRLDGKVFQSKTYDGMIVSVVGTFASLQQLLCSDNVSIALDVSNAELPSDLDTNMACELVGQQAGDSLVVSKVYIVARTICICIRTVCVSV
jgi:hypothetical protein